MSLVATPKRVAYVLFGIAALAEAAGLFVYVPRYYTDQERPLIKCETLGLPEGRVKTPHLLLQAERPRPKRNRFDRFREKPRYTGRLERHELVRVSDKRASWIHVCASGFQGWARLGTVDYPRDPRDPLETVTIVGLPVLAFVVFLWLIPPVYRLLVPSLGAFGSLWAWAFFSGVKRNPDAPFISFLVFGVVLVVGFVIVAGIGLSDWAKDWNRNHRDWPFKTLNGPARRRHR